MNIEERILQRKRRGERRRLLVEETVLSPVWHPESPVGRGATIERLLDRLDPVFDGETPDDVYVHGPSGSGKSAVVTALFRHLSRHLSSPTNTIQTTTRSGSESGTIFAYVDVRTATSEFEFSHRLLDESTEESVPRRGLSTDELRRRIRQTLRTQSLVVALDHVDDVDPTLLEWLSTEREEWSRDVAVVAVGRARPATAPAAVSDASVVELTPYHRAEVTDILTSRTTAGLARDAVTHDQIRTLATWSEGDAHDALAALLGSVDAALDDGATVIEERHLRAGIDSVPRPCASLGRVLALADNRQEVLRYLLELDDADRSSVQKTADALASRSSLSASTIRRYLYELAEQDIIARVQADESDGAGRPPSRVEPRFPTRAFERLTAVDN
ncbi:Cdc6-related protein, AAA superfamily ATPase [Halopelagius inordinatus]|uniref:Cdc6-related protein, AAA superfamily ATPase n=1 Tax=Halopelagius inordinatus TaxID=553467 RepID=A0A1I2WP63_9EURY|nr:AAA family ATPase [Halopelagius inordinatus]SFH02477.1 Cdc6-related protein, AAA superfamily ATPase [Halopelagius inordinatus]